MDSLGWVLLILIIAVVATLIYLNSRPKPTPEPKPPEPPPSPKPPEPTPEKNKYVTIYEYTSVQHVKKCAYCDGENAYGTKVCRICGNDIDG